VIHRLDHHHEELPEKDDPKGSNVIVRGVTPAAFDILPSEARRLTDVPHWLERDDRFAAASAIASSIPASATRSSSLAEVHRGRFFDGAARPSSPEMWMDVGYLAASRRLVGTIR